jgi:hypothetical protein
MIYVERALSDRSVCVRCGNAIKMNMPRLRLKLTGHWGFIFCNKCVDILVAEWEDFKRREIY